MPISKEVLQIAVDGLEVLIRGGEKSLKMIREQEEYKRRVPWERNVMADPADQAQADREQIELERGIRDRLAARKVAVRALKAALK